MITDGVLLGGLVALALLGLDVQQLRPLEVAHVTQGLDQGVDVVAVDGAYVVEAELLEQGAGHHHSLEVFLGPLGQLLDRRQAGQHLLATLADGGVELARHDAGQVVVERPDIFGDGHLVVVEHHQHVLVDIAGVIERLERHAGGDGAIADHRHHLAAKPFALTATAMPSAAPMEVLEWPTESTSYSLSPRQGRGADRLSGGCSASDRGDR